MVFKPVVEWKNPLFRVLGYLLLFPFSLFYGIFAECRNILYDSGFFRKHTFESFIIGVGSLSVGGSGKTPLAEFLAIQLAQRRVRVGVISNGYRKTSRETVIVTDGKIIKETVSRSGDEAYVMAINFIVAGLEIPVVSGSDRIEAVKICEEQFNCSVIIIDDAFQYRKITKSVEFVVQDYFESMFPHLTLPAGRLREFRRNIRRADAVILSKTPEAVTDKSVALRWRKDIIISRYQPVYLQKWFKPDKFPLGILNNQKIILFSALGYNESFVNAVSTLCFKYNALIECKLEFQDHYRYNKNTLQKIFNRIKGLSPFDHLVLTTQKDAVKMQPEWVPDEWQTHVYFLKAEFSMESQIQFENLIKIPQINLDNQPI